MALRGMESVEEVDAGDQPKDGVVDSVEETTAVATTTAAPPPATMSGTAAELQGAGFEGMDQEDPMAYPTISLKGDNFEDRDGNNYGSDVNIIVLGSKNKFVIKPHEQADTDQLKYAYGHPDNVTVPNDFDAGGVPLQAVYDKWVAEGSMQQGAKPVVKKYLELTAVLMDGDRAGQSVIISVAPTSTGEFALYANDLRRIRQVFPNQCITNMKTSEKVGSGAKKFRKFKFSYVGPYEG